MIDSVVHATCRSRIRRRWPAPRPCRPCRRHAVDRAGSDAVEPVSKLDGAGCSICEQAPYRDSAPPRACGSSASRRPSPIRLMASTVDQDGEAREGASIQGWDMRSGRACRPASTPHSGWAAGAPRPRKPRPAASRHARLARPSAACTMQSVQGSWAARVSTSSPELRAPTPWPARRSSRRRWFAKAVDARPATIARQPRRW